MKGSEDNRADLDELLNAAFSVSEQDPATERAAIDRVNAKVLVSDSASQPLADDRERTLQRAFAVADLPAEEQEHRIAELFERVDGDRHPSRRWGLLAGAFAALAALLLVVAMWAPGSSSPSGEDVALDELETRSTPVAVDRVDSPVRAVGLQRVSQRAASDVVAKVGAGGARVGRQSARESR